jgi:hypothetical protein
MPASPPATSTATSTSAPTSAPSPADSSKSGLVVDCGPLVSDVGTCLGVVGAAASSLGVDDPPVTGVVVRTLESEVTQGPSPSPGVSGSPAVEIETYMVAYSVEFSRDGGPQGIAVSRTYGGWVAGRPLAATRTYRVPPGTGSWTEPDPFALKAGEYRITGECVGPGSAPGGVMVVLQQVRDDGTVLADVHHVRCGPVELTAIFGDTVTLDDGRYRLVIEENDTSGLTVDLEPVTTLE